MKKNTIDFRSFSDPCSSYILHPPRRTAPCLPQKIKLANAITTPERHKSKLPIPDPHDMQASQRHDTKIQQA
jgi:hypothetical protein